MRQSRRVFPSKSHLISVRLTRSVHAAIRMLEFLFKLLRGSGLGWAGHVLAGRDRRAMV